MSSNCVRSTRRGRRRHRVGEDLRPGRSAPRRPCRRRTARSARAPRAATSAGVRLYCGELVGPEPDAHRIVRGAEERSVADARHAPQLVEHVQQRVVADVDRVVAAVRRRQGDHLQDRGRALLHRHALAAAPRRGSSGSGALHAVVDVDGGLVGVGADLEGDRESHRARAGRGRAACRSCPRRR